MIILIEINTTIHTVRDDNVSEHSSGISRIIDVANDDSRIALIDAQVFEQRNTVFNPNACRLSKSCSRNVVHDNISKDTT